MGPGGSFPRVKAAGRDSDHPTPTSAKVKNIWSYDSTPPYVFMEWCLVKHWDNLAFSCSFNQMKDKCALG